VHESGREFEPRPTKIEERLPAESREIGPAKNAAAHDSERESEPRVAKGEEPVPSESREACPTDPAAERDFLERLVKEAEESCPPEKRGWLGLK
jgi:hypothetical protein